MSDCDLPEATATWTGFEPGLWQKEINVRDFIQRNYMPYDGDDSFLAPATARTKKIWERLNELFVEERKKGVLDISQIPVRSPRTRRLYRQGYESSSDFRPRRR